MENNKSYINKEQDRRISAVETHIANTNREIGDIKIDLAEVKTDVSWLKRYFWIVVAASVGALVTGLINLLK